MERLIRALLYVLYIIFILHNSAYSQFEIISNSEPVKSIEEIYSLNIHNYSGNLLNIKLEVIMSKNGSVIYKAITNSVTLLTGSNFFTEARFLPINVQKNIYNLNNGLQEKVEIRVNMLDDKNIVRQSLTIRNNENSLSIKGNEYNRLIKTKGNIVIQSQVSSNSGNFSELPDKYLRLEAYPTFILKNVPLGINLLLSTEDNSSKEALNQISFQFDQKELQRNLQSVLQNKLLDQEIKNQLLNDVEISKVTSKIINSKFPEFDTLDHSAMVLEIEQYQAQRRKLDNINLVLSNHEVKSYSQKLKKLESKANLTQIEIMELSALKQNQNDLGALKLEQINLDEKIRKNRKLKKLSTNLSKYKKFKQSDVYKDPKFTYSSLKKLGAISNFMSVLNHVKNLQIGNHYPYYSKYSLNGIAVNGVNLELTPLNWYINFVYGNSSRFSIDSSYILPKVNLSQHTIGFKFGYGQQENAHFHFSLVDIRDKVSSLAQVSNTAPQYNRLLSLHGGINFLERKIQLKAELTSSFLTRDTRLNVEATDFNKIPFGSLKLLLPNEFNSSSFADYVYSGQLIINPVNQTKIQASYDYIGPQFYSLGSFGVMKNLIRRKIDVQQKFLKNQIVANLYLRHDNQDGSLVNNHLNSVWQYGLSSQINLRNLPSLNFQFSPFQYKSNIALQNIKGMHFNTTLNYAFVIKEAVNVNSTIQFSTQEMVGAQTLNQFTYQSLNFYEMIQYKFIGLQASYSFFPKFFISNNSISQKNFDLSLSLKILNKIGVNLGYLQSESDFFSKRKGVYGEINITIIQHLDMKIKFNSFNYISSSIPNGSDQFGQLLISYNW